MPQPKPWNQTAASARNLSWTAKDVENVGSSGSKLVEQTFPSYRLTSQILLKALKEIFPNHTFKDEPIVRFLHSVLRLISTSPCCHHLPLLIW